MQGMVPESKNSPGWVVQRFGGVSIRKFGVKFVEDIVKFVSLVSLQIIHICERNQLTGIEQVSEKTEWP